MKGELARLMAQFPRAGVLTWIGIRPQRRIALSALTHVEVIAGSGLAGDHYASKYDGKRQVTLFQEEHLDVVAKMLGKSEVSPAIVRRNLVVSGINLHALRNMQFRIGRVLLEGTGPCEPCSRMEEVLGTGGYNAMRGHGGITARVIQGGELFISDRVEVALPDPMPPVIPCTASEVK
ncbi:MAG: MOSC domain-containing protein [Burkholderiales bacterium]